MSTYIPNSFKTSMKFSIGAFLLVAGMNCVAQPGPPCLEPCPDGGGGGAGAGIYDLYASDTNSRPVIPFSVNWPQAPSITDEVTVSTNSDLNFYKGRAGHRITVTPGTYDALTGLADDIHIILQEGVVIQHSNSDGTKGLYLGGSRQWISGPGIINGGFRFYGEYGASDAVLDGVKIRPVGTTINAIGSGSTDIDIRGGSRVAVLNSDIRSVGGQYTYFAVASTDDHIIANTRIDTSGSAAGAWRFGGGGNRIVFVDNYVRGTTGYAVWRLHNSANNIWFRGNHMEANTQGLWLDTYTAPSPGSGAQSNIWIYDNRWYGVPTGSQAPALSVRDNGSYPVTNLTVDGDIWYSNAGSPGSQVSSHCWAAKLEYR